jgi:hypothetical protein
MIAVAIALAVGAATLPPVDQCSSDPSFARFRSNLVRIVDRRDAKALLAVVADDVMVNFDNSVGPRAFTRVWRLNGPKAGQSRVWRELRAVMQLGCANLGSTLVMPSLIGQLSASEQLEKFIALPGAKLRQSASLRGRSLATMNFHVVTFRESKAPEGWIGVALSDGRKGYLCDEEVRAALEYRAQFEKIGGRWRMTSFVEGD